MSPAVPAVPPRIVIQSCSTYPYIAVLLLALHYATCSRTTRFAATITRNVASHGRTIEALGATRHRSHVASGTFGLLASTTFTSGCRPTANPAVNAIPLVATTPVGMGVNRLLSLVGDVSKIHVRV